MKQVYDLGEAALTPIHPCPTLRSEADLCLLDIALSPLKQTGKHPGSSLPNHSAFQFTMNSQYEWTNGQYLLSKVEMKITTISQN